MEIIDSNTTTSPSPTFSSDPEHDGLVASDFLNATSNQLTYYGLTSLVESILDPEEIAVLFRNNHFSCIYNRVRDEGGFELCSLVTGIHTFSSSYMLDAGFTGMADVVWEAMVDAQGDSLFLDPEFRPCSTGPPKCTGRSRDSWVVLIDSCSSRSCRRKSSVGLFTKSPIAPSVEWAHMNTTE